MKLDGGYRDRARETIAQGALTNSKRAETFIDGIYPTHVRSGFDSFLVDHNGDKYTDYICGLGTNLLGYGAISRQLIDYLSRAENGISLSLSTVHEIHAAEALKDHFPFIERIKFLKTGSEACNAAVRIARSYTGRDMVLSDGYHGWGDDFICLEPPGSGIPLGRRATCRKLIDLNDIDEGTAAVIVEPVIIDYSEERFDFLRRLRARCDEKGAVLIFDEIITGFRFTKLSVSNAIGVRPDLICLGKALGGGMPLSAVCGRKDLMDDPRYFVSSTFAGEVLSLIACKAFLEKIDRKKIESLWASGRKWLDQFNSIAPDMLRVEGYPTRGVFKGSDIAKAYFFQEACLAKILFGPSWFYNIPLSEMIEEHRTSIGEILCKALSKMRMGEPLKGKMPVPPLAQMMRR